MARRVEEDARVADRGAGVERRRHRARAGAGPGMAGRRVLREVPFVVLDGALVAGILVAFTGRELMPQIVPGFEVLAPEPNFEQRVAAMRAEEGSYRQRWQYQNESEEERQAAFDVAHVLREYIEAFRAAAKAGQLVALPPKQWRSGSPLSNARTAARRCGGTLSLFTDEAVELLDALPREAAP